MFKLWKRIKKKSKKFCSKSCASTYNNSRREKSLRPSFKKIEKTHSSENRDKKLQEKKKCEIYCLECGKKLKGFQRKFCSQECSNKFHKKQHYQYFLDNTEEFCRDNFTPRRYIREFILKEQFGICAICGSLQEHNGKPLVFVLDHIDGNSANNYRKNLRMICPNCDSQLPTFKSKNKDSQRRNYLRENIEKKVIEKIKLGEIQID